LENTKHPGTATVETLSPLSWHYDLPCGDYGFYSTDTATMMPSPSVPHTAVQQAIGPYAPLAHALIVRGVGTDVHMATASTNAVGAARLQVVPLSSLAAYGRALDRYVARAGCPSACHAAFRSPLALPVTFPRQLFDRSRGAHGFDTLGAELTSAGDAAAVDVPFSVPAVTHLSTGPRYQPALKTLQAAFNVSRRDAARQRFDSSDASATHQQLQDAGSALAQMVDDYAARHEDDAYD
jgi:hypothetical protein